MRASLQAALTEPGRLADPVEHLLHPGDVVCAGRGERLVTLLGSCVAVILTDPRRTVGAMCHIVHPGEAPRADPADTAWASAALARMSTLLRCRGIVPGLCEAYVIGGANMFPGLIGPRHVGELNARAALAWLRREGAVVRGQDVGGDRYRHVAWVVGPQDPEVRLGDAPARDPAAEGTP